MDRLFKSNKLRITGVVLAVCLIYALPLFTLTGATDFFLNVEGIKGESKDAYYKDWIEAMEHSYGITRETSKLGSIPALSDFTIQKRADLSSPLLFRDSVTKMPRQVDLELVNAGSFERLRYYRVRLYDALVTSFSVTGNSDGPATEQVSFSFSKIEMTYTDRSTKTPQDITASYNIVTSQPANTAPTISAISSTNTLEDTAVSVAFTVGDAETAAGSLTLSASSSNTSLVPTANISFSGSGSSRTAIISPAANQNGTANITISVSDGSLSANRTFTLTVNPVNDAPTISAIPAKATEMGVPLTFSFVVGDVDNAASNLVVTATSSSQTVVANSNIALSGTNANRSATISPNAVGDTWITFRVSDGELQASNTFLFTVNAYTPDSPTNIVLSSSSVPENSTNGFVIGTLTAQDPDSIAHTFTLLDSAGGRFRIQANRLEVNNGSLLNYEEDASHVVLVRATDPDNLTYSRNFTIQVGNVNEAPSFFVSNAAVIEAIAGRPTPIARLQVSDPDAAMGALLLTLQVVNGTISINSNFNGTITSNGTAEVRLSGTLPNLNSLLSSSNGVVYRAVTNLSGTDLLTATLDDQGNTGSGGALSVFTTLGIRFYRTQYEQWLHQNFTENELNNPSTKGSLWGPQADSDGDGLGNIVEYAIGTPPRNGNHPKPAATLASSGGEKFLSLQMQRRKDPDLTLTVESADEVAPQTWSSAAVQSFPPTDLNNGFEAVRFDDRVATTDAARRFMRTRWTLANAP